jgi:NADH dehydrogenase FAD-containing subunit
MKQVIIIGGGFAGSTAARLLQKDFSVTLIDQKYYFEYTPGVLRIIQEQNHPRNLLNLSFY